jgi:hypothetical protein
MQKIIMALLLLGGLSLLASCAGGDGGVAIYHPHHDHGPWWGSRDYYRERVIVVPEEPVVEATPSEPVEMPDMGMPDID